MTPEIDQLSRQLHARIDEIRATIQTLTGEKYILERELRALLTGKNPHVVLAELEVREIVLSYRHAR